MTKHSKKRHVELDLGTCNGCQGCVDLNPDIFAWDEATDRPLVVKAKATLEEIQDALNCCPGDCILTTE